MYCKKSFLLTSLIFIFLVGCATTPPVREALKEDLKVPVGKIEENQFTGIRYPFNVSVPSHWKMSMEFPDFLKELGYDKPSPTDKEQTELYIFNPLTQSCVQIDFSPANPRFVASQGAMEGLVGMGASSLKEELQQEHGKNIQVEIGPTTPYSLRGVQFAAKKYAIYTINGVKREQGWIYGFTEPNQIFILYMILEKEGANERQDIEKILDSFEVISKK
jgi:hypothetical protein